MTNPKTSLLYYPVESLLLVLPDGNPMANYFPALDRTTDEERNEIGVPSSDLTLLNRLQNNDLSDNPHRWTKKQCQERITQLYDYIGDVSNLQGRKFYQISVVASNIEQWILLIKNLREARQAEVGKTFDWPEGQILNEIEWSANFQHTTD